MYLMLLLPVQGLAIMAEGKLTSVKGVGGIKTAILGQLEQGNSV